MVAKAFPCASERHGTGTTPSFRSAYFEFLPTPTISKVLAGPPGVASRVKRVPTTGAPDRAIAAANVSLTTATGGDCGVSASLKSRPAVIGVPIVAKKPLPTQFSRVGNCRD